MHVALCLLKQNKSSRHVLLHFMLAVKVLIVLFLFLTAKVIRFSQLMTLLPQGTGMLGSKKVLVFIILFSFLDSQSNKVQSVDDTVASWYRSSGHYPIITTCCCLGTGMLGS